MLGDERLNCTLGSFHIGFWTWSTVYDPCVEHLSGRINDSDLTAGPVAGVETEDNAVFKRRLHEYLTKICRKHFDSLFSSICRQVGADLTFDRREDKSLVAVLRSGFYEFAAGIIGSDKAFGDESACACFIELEGNLEEALLFAAVECEDAVVSDLLDRL